MTLLAITLSSLAFLVLFVSLPFLMGWFFQRRRGSELLLEESPWHELGNNRYAKLLTLRNRGNFHALILEAWVRPDSLTSEYRSLKLYNLSQKPEYPYFKTAIIKSESSKKGPKELKLLLEVETSGGGKPISPLELLLLFYDNAPMRVRRFPLTNFDLSSEPLYPDENPDNSTPLESSEEVSLNEYSTQVLTLTTPIIRDEDQLVDYLLRGLNIYMERYKALPDLIGISESVVAIVQGRAYSVYELRVSLLSRLLTGFFNEDSSMSSPYAFQLVLQKVGLLRILLGIWGGVLGKLLGRKGWFYVIAGREASSVDDCGGTTPPFDKYVVLAPENPSAYAERLWRRLKESLELSRDLRVAVIDANDLGAVDILGAYPELGGELSRKVKELLRSNPQGNEDERRPIVFIRELFAERRLENEES